MDRWAEYRRKLGRRGEELAAAYLERAGMRVLARNWRAPGGAGEIDIVARDGPFLVVAEVKTRGSLRHGHPVEAITESKRRRLRGLGRSWALLHRCPPRPLRIDGVCLLVAGGRVFVSHERGMG
ncbi:YraN family protein [Nocardiopsis sp. SBT366]|uniref:YraN family protein n=1 Tax=Nocardiopsis sp. SBT366 TaxID=1580529 RepID=UPI00066DEA2F|nr:YraN family protein [Nocardiopsis sp. SBT366]